MGLIDDILESLGLSGITTVDLGTVHVNLTSGECPCILCSCRPSDCCVDFAGTFGDDGMADCEISDGFIVMCNNLCELRPDDVACIEFTTDNIGKFCRGDTITLDMTTYSINAGGTAGGYSPTILLATDYEDCSGSSWGEWEVVEYSPTSGGPVVYEGAGGAAVVWEDLDPEVGFADGSYSVTFRWVDNGECPLAGGFCGNYQIRMFGTAGRVGDAEHLYEGSDPRTCEDDDTDPG